MRRKLFVAVGLAILAGVLGVGNPAANHKPPKGQAVTVKVRGNATVTIKFGQHGRPSKPFYGTLELRVRALGLSPVTRVCGVVRYSGGVSGRNTVCSDLGRWIWLKRGNFLSASLQITTPLPARCRMPQPHNPPHVTQRVIMTFWLDCRRAKPVTPPVTPPQPPTFGPEVILQVGCNVPGTNAFIEVRTSNGVQVITIGCNLTQKIQVPSGAIEVCIVGLPPGATVQIISGGVFTSPNCIRVTGGVLVITIAIVVDVCSNIEGVQTSVPAGLVRDSAGSCVAPSAPPSPSPPPPGPPPPPPPPPPTPTPNQRPVADAGLNQELAMIGGSVSFCLNGSGSFDPDGGNIVSHVWTGTVNPPDVANPCVTVTEPGVYSFTLTVTDDEGSTDTDQATVSVIGEPPG